MKTEMTQLNYLTNKINEANVLLKAIHGLIVDDTKNLHDLTIEYMLLKRKYNIIKFENYDSYMDYCDDVEVIKDWNDGTSETREILKEVIDIVITDSINSLKTKMEVFLNEESKYSDTKN